MADHLPRVHPLVSRKDADLRLLHLGDSQETGRHLMVTNLLLPEVDHHLRQMVFQAGDSRATDLPVEDHLVEDPQKVTSRAISLRIRKIDVPSFMLSSLSHNPGPIKRTPGNPTGSQERTQRKSKSSLSSASFSSRMTSSHIQLTNERSTPPSPISKDWHSIGLLRSSLPLPFRPC